MVLVRRAGDYSEAEMIQFDKGKKGWYFSVLTLAYNQIRDYFIKDKLNLLDFFLSRCVVQHWWESGKGYQVEDKTLIYLFILEKGAEE